MDFGRNDPAKRNFLSPSMTLLKYWMREGSSDLILLDFKKAFDKVSHHRLLLKTEHYGGQRINSKMDC